MSNSKYKTEKAYYLVEKRRTVQEKTESSSSESVVTDYFMVISGANDQEEDEKGSFSYMVQWDVYSQQEAGYSPFKKDHDLYVGKKKHNAQKEKHNAREQISDVKDKHRVYKMEKMEDSDIQKEGILVTNKDNTKIYQTVAEKPNSEDKNDEHIKESKKPEHIVYYMRQKGGGRRRKPKIDLETSYFFMMTKELTREDERNISTSGNKNQICVYRMVEMKCTDPERNEILSAIKDIRRSIWKAIVGLLKIAAAILIVWSDEKTDNKSCEIYEALQLLQVNFSIPCKYDDVKKCLENSFSISMVSLSVDVFWFIFGSILMMICPERQKRTCVAVYVFGIFLSGLVFGALFLQTKKTVVDSKTQLTDINYAQIKTFMIKSLEEHYTSDVITNNDTMSDRWNNFFIKYDCCAVNQVASTTNDFDTTPWCTTSGSCQQTNSQIPKTCCKDVTEDDYMNAENSCHATVSSGTYKDSCFAQVKKFDDEAMTENDVDFLSVILGTIGILKVASVVSVFVICVFQIIRDKFHKTWKQFKWSFFTGRYSRLAEP